MSRDTLSKLYIYNPKTGKEIAITLDNDDEIRCLYDTYYCGTGDEDEQTHHITGKQFFDMLHGKWNLSNQIRKEYDKIFKEEISRYKNEVKVLRKDNADKDKEIDKLKKDLASIKKTFRILKEK